MMTRFFEWLTTEFPSWFVKHHDGVPSWKGIICWWEARRVPYNLVIIWPLAIVTYVLLIMLIALSHDFIGGEGSIAPVLSWTPSFMITILYVCAVANVLYTSGWLSEIFLNVIWKEAAPNIGPVLLKLGLSFSVVAVWFVVIVWCLLWLMEQI